MKTDQAARVVDIDASARGFGITRSEAIRRLESMANRGDALREPTGYSFTAVQWRRQRRDWLRTRFAAHDRSERAFCASLATGSRGGAR
ncbi:hypothetical protein [Microbacterium sp. Bi121]|uniref:hypothetical protein n=1 Tax=Microbacterium sp. Bi121 TaxID=2822348 RepID=UPI001D9AE96A|nr:hypothetical protein [Microbacterium sp. Bi121]CAH0207287.1 hypothetical protein SRABI121_02635 [Microbacterium sp. Bi121]